MMKQDVNITEQGRGKPNFNSMWFLLNRAAELLIIAKSSGIRTRFSWKKKKRKGPRFDLLERPGCWYTRSSLSPFCTSLIPLRSCTCVSPSLRFSDLFRQWIERENLQANYPWPGWIWRTCQASCDWSSQRLSGPGLVRTAREVDKPLRWASQTSNPTRQERQ